MQFIKIKEIKPLNGKEMRVLVRNVSDNIVRITRVDLIEILPEPIERRMLFGLIKTRVKGMLIGTKIYGYGILSHEVKIKPDEEYWLVIPLEKSLDENHKYKLAIKGEVIVGYARTLLESRVEVKKEFIAIYEFTIKNGKIHELREISTQIRE